MKKIKGFTLVELLAVITLLAAIILVSIPSIINTLKNNENKVSKQFDNALINACELYVERNRNMFTELNVIGGTIDVEAQTLLNEGYLTQNLESPDENTSVGDYIITVTVNSDETLKYEVKSK